MRIQKFARIVAHAAAAIIVVQACRAGDLKPILFSAIAAQTNAAVGTATVRYPAAVADAHSQPFWLEGIYVTLTGASGATCTVAVATQAAGFDLPARTLATVAGVTASAYYPVRDIVCTAAGVDISNVPARIPVFGSPTMKLYAANKAGITGEVALVLSPVP